MKWFYGTKGLGTSIINAARALSPIDIHRGATARAALPTAERTVSQWSDDLLRQVNRVMRVNKKAWNVMGGNRPSVPEMVTGYFKGENVMDMALRKGPANFRRRFAPFASTPEQMATRQMARVGVVGAAGLYAGTSLLAGSDNPLSSTISAGFRAGTHVGIGWGVGQIPFKGAKWAGLGYVGFAAANALRSGDNIGPF
jgi:hypothetical protein